MKQPAVRPITRVTTWSRPHAVAVSAKPIEHVVAMLRGLDTVEVVIHVRDGAIACLERTERLRPQVPLAIEPALKR